MRPLNCLDRCREHQAPAPRGAVRSETLEERFLRVLQQAETVPADSAAAARWAGYWSGLDRRSQF